jgi:hypothetical protein
MLAVAADNIGGGRSAIRLAPASNIASTFSLTISCASRSASSSAIANFVRRRRITSQASNASMVLASQGKLSLKLSLDGSKKLFVAMSHSLSADHKDVDFVALPRSFECNENAL